MRLEEDTVSPKTGVVMKDMRAMARVVQERAMAERRESAVRGSERHQNVRKLEVATFIAECLEYQEFEIGVKLSWR
jgi:hypothetical protein